LVSEAQRIVDEKDRVEWERKAAEGEFSLEDFKNQLEKFAKPGLMTKLLGFMPGMGQITEMLAGADTEGETRKLIGIINSMTQAERRNPKIIEPSRRMRIAKGAGVQPQEVNQLVKQYETMKPLVTGMAGKGMGDKMKMINEMRKSGMLDPGAKFNRPKGDTGKRLTSEEKKKLKKQREKDLRKKKRKGGDSDDGSSHPSRR
jgi:signal recognition particle subunit SRP54